MDVAFDGFEPRVGEIDAVRAFRLSSSGALLPLFHDSPWTTGTNTASCATTPGGGATGSHRAPDPDCRCGFYASATANAAREYPESAHVLGVVSCWGRTIVGTRGLRVEHARIRAVWLSEAVPAELAVAVVWTYPDVELYADRELMLTEHPVTALDCYDAPPAVISRSRTWWWRVLTSLAVVVGTVAGLDQVAPSTRVALGMLAGGLLATGLVAGRVWSTEAIGRRRGLVVAAAVLWLVAGLAGGLAQWFLRVPLTELALVGVVLVWRARRAANRFRLAAPQTEGGHGRSRI